MQCAMCACYGMCACQQHEQNIYRTSLGTPNGHTLGAVWPQQGQPAAAAAPPATPVEQPPPRCASRFTCGRKMKKSTCIEGGCSSRAKKTRPTTAIEWGSVQQQQTHRHKVGSTELLASWLPKKWWRSPVLGRGATPYSQVRPAAAQ